METEDELASWAIQLDLPHVDFDTLDFGEVERASAKVPVELARKYNMVPITWYEEVLYVASSDPQVVTKLDELQKTIGCEIQLTLALRSQVAAAIERLYETPDAT